MGQSAVRPLSSRRLETWGWDETWAGLFEPHAARGLVPARVVAQHRGRWRVAGAQCPDARLSMVAADGVLPASLTGRLRHGALTADDVPAVGDWVACLPPDAAATQIEALLPRRSTFLRRAAGPRAEAQVLAANVDVLLVATSLNRDLNPRRLERYLSMARESGAEPVLLVTKTDLARDAAAADAAARKLGGRLGVRVASVSAVSGDGLDALAALLKPATTVALVGSSGVGKSTLLNRLVGADVQATAAIREDDARGRHVTSHRELFLLPGGAILLDSPGMRELGLWDADAGVDETFGELAELARRCRFGDCRHEREPGCAIQAALGGGRIDAGRLRSWRRLMKEVADQPSPAMRSQANRRFQRMVRDIAGHTEDRKTWRWRDS